MTSEYKITLAPKTLESADPAAKAVLDKAKEQVGFIPNMYAGMVNSPGLLDTYLEGYSHFRKGSAFTSVEQEVVFLTISHENRCHYCMAAHSMLADSMSKVPGEVTDAIREGRSISDQKLDALNRFTVVMVESRGLPGRKDVDSFLAAGYSEQNVLDIILAIAVKTLSNYSNHLLHTPVDEMFASRIWSEFDISSSDGGTVAVAHPVSNSKERTAPI